MSNLDIYHPDVVRAFAAAWASIDGKLEEFEQEETTGKMEGGHYDGYMIEANELLQRAAKRLPPSIDLWTLLTPPNP